MDLAVILTLVGIGVATVTAAFTGWQSYETHRQRRLAEAAKTSASPHDTQEQSIEPKPRPTREWVCGVYDYPPLSVAQTSPALATSGLLVELAAQVFLNLKQPFKFVYFNYDGFYEDENRIPDAVIGMFETRRRAQRMRFSRPVYEIGLQGICRADLDGDLFESLRCGSLRVAVYSGEVGWEFLKDELPDVLEEQRAAIVQGGHQRDTMTHLESGSYDVVLMDEVSCLNFLNEGTNATRFKLAFPHPPQTFDTCIAVRAIHADRLKEIDEELGRIRNSQWYLDRESVALKGFEGVIAKRGLKKLPQTG